MLGIRSWDAIAQREIFGRNPVFIFDPVDRSNEAIEMDDDPSGEAGGTALSYWRIYPQFVRDIFTRAFSDGLKRPANRPTDLDWLNNLARLRDTVFRCHCGSPNYYDPIIRGAQLQSPSACWSCGNTPSLPFRIKIGRMVAMLNHDTRLFPHHLLGEDSAFDYSTAIAMVTQHPSLPDRWGLKNLGTTKWVALFPDGAARDVEPGRSAPLADGVRIIFGRTEGIIRY